MKISRHFTTILIIVLFSTIVVATAKLTTNLPISQKATQVWANSSHWISSALGQRKNLPPTRQPVGKLGVSPIAAQATGASLPEIDVAVTVELGGGSALGEVGTTLFDSASAKPFNGKVRLSGGTPSFYDAIQFGGPIPSNPNATGEARIRYSATVSFPSLPSVAPIRLFGVFSRIARGFGIIDEFISIDEPSLFSLQSTELGKFDVAVIRRENSFTRTLRLGITWKTGLNDCAFPTVTQQPISSTVCENGATTFSVSANGNGALLYQWQKNGQPIAGATSANLTMAAVKPSDVGSYSVIVSDSCGAIISNAVPLQLRAPSECGSNTGTGSNVTVSANNTVVTFSNVTTAGNTTITPIAPASAGTLPNGYVLVNGSLAFEITTTAVFSGPITITFNVPGVTDAAIFSTLRVLHGEGSPQALVDRTVLAPDTPAPNFATKQISARVTSLSPFVITQLQTNNVCDTVKFVPQPEITVSPANSSRFHFADINGDGHVDLLEDSFSNLSNVSTITVRLNNGNGTFGTGITSTGSMRNLFTIGDVNKDKLPDLIYGNAERSASAQVEIFLNQGNGTFKSAQLISGIRQGGIVENAIREIIVRDLNGDGNADVWVKVHGTRGFPETFLGYAFSAILSGKGNGTFEIATTIQDRESSADRGIEPSASSRLMLCKWFE